MSDIPINMYTLPAAVAIALIIIGMFCQHKNIVFEDRRLHPSQFKLWSEIIIMAAYVFILPTAAEQLTTHVRTNGSFIATWGTALGVFTLSFSSLLKFLKHRKKL